MNQSEINKLKRIPTRGDYGGPLVTIRATYEDGSELVLAHDHPAIKSLIAAQKGG